MLTRRNLDFSWILSVCTLLFFFIVGANRSVASEAAAVFYSTDDFNITEFDRQMYLRDAPPTPGETIGSRARNLQAVSDLYAMEIIAGDATGLGLLTQSEQAWIAAYAVRFEVVKRYIQFEVNRKLERTDWSAEAAEVYLADQSAYQNPERVSVRTLLIRTEERSEEEAMTIASELLVEAERGDTDFAALVSASTEDENARADGGLMSDLVRGQTVAPFEAAAFALREPGELSEPVVSQFGVHLIQLVEYQSPRQRTLEETREEIIAELRPLRASQYREAIQLEARERKPPGFVEHTDALDALMLRTNSGSLGVGID